MRLNTAYGLAVVTVLAACAEPPVVVPPDISWLAQSWTVTEAWPLEYNAPAAPLGQKVNLAEIGTGDVGGRVCPKGILTLSEQPLSVILGGEETLDELGRIVPKVTYSCDGQAFGAYARIEPQELVTRFGPWLLWLRPSKTVIAIPFQTQVIPGPQPILPAMASMAVTPADPAEHAATVVQPMPSDKRQVYLASYTQDMLALKGFDEIKHLSQALSQAKPILKPIDIPGKGHYVRLFAQVDGPALADQICNDLRGQIKDSCAPNR